MVALLSLISKGSFLVFFLATEGNAVQGRVEEVEHRRQIRSWHCASRPDSVFTTVIRIQVSACVRVFVSQRRTFFPMFLLLIDDSTSILNYKQDVAQSQVPTSPKDEPPVVAAHRGDRDSHPLHHASAPPTVVLSEQRFKICLSCFLFFLFGSYSGLLGLPVFFIAVRLVKRVNRALCNCLIQNELAVPSRVPGGLRLQIHLRLAHCLPHRDPGPNLHVHCNQWTRSRR